MTYARSGAAPAAGASGLLGFPGEALLILRNGRLMEPAAILFVVMALANIAPKFHVPAQAAWNLAVAILPLIALFGVAAAVLRVMNESPRPRWRPDGAFWLYCATIAAGLGLSAAVAQLVGDEDPGSGLRTGAIVSMLSAPFAPWFTAIAVERPLAWQAGAWMRRFGLWLPPLLIWSLILVLPLGQAYTALHNLIGRTENGWFWMLVLLDSVLSVLLFLLGLALASTAYRRVARG